MLFVSGLGGFLVFILMSVLPITPPVLGGSAWWVACKTFATTQIDIFVNGLSMAPLWASRRTSGSATFS